MFYRVPQFVWKVTTITEGTRNCVSVLQKLLKCHLNVMSKLDSLILCNSNYCYLLLVKSYILLWYRNNELLENKISNQRMLMDDCNLREATFGLTINKMLTYNHVNNHNISANNYILLTSLLMIIHNELPVLKRRSAHYTSILIKIKGFI